MFKLENYNYLLGARKDRIVALLKYACNELDFHKTPASTKHHLDCEGGLIRHSENVLNIMLRMNEANNYQLDPESMFLVSMFHDIGKCGWPDTPYYIPYQGFCTTKKQAYYFKWKPQMGPWQEHKKPSDEDDPLYDYNTEINKIPHALLSVGIVSAFMFPELQLDEIQAIGGHNGYFTKMGKEIMPSLSNWYDLTICLHHADVEAAKIVERK